MRPSLSAFVSAGSSLHVTVRPPRCVIWETGGHCCDTLQQPDFVQPQIGCESFPMPQSDIAQPVFSADFWFWTGRVLIWDRNRTSTAGARRIIWPRDSEILS